MNYIPLIIASIITINLATFMRACSCRRNIGEDSSVEDYGYLFHSINIIAMYIGKFGHWLGCRMMRR